MFMAEVVAELCAGNCRLAEQRFGWGRETVRKGLLESRQGIRCLENFAAKGRRRHEDKNPQLAADIRAIVEPHTQADPELKSARRYTNLTAAAVRQALLDKGHATKVMRRRSCGGGHAAKVMRQRSCGKGHAAKVMRRRRCPRSVRYGTFSTA